MNVKPNTHPRLSRIVMVPVVVLIALTSVSGARHATATRSLGSSESAQGATGTRGAPHSASLPAIRASSTPRGAPPTSAMAHPRQGANPSAEVTPAPAGRTDHDEVENGEARNPTSSKQLIYHGGPVQTTPRVYLVLWGPNWFTNGDPYGVANREHYFYQGVGGSSIANVLKQYGSYYGSFSNPSGQYKGWIHDTTPVAAQPTKDDIARAAIRAAVKMNDFNYNAQYVVATPWGVVDQFATAKSFCGWHDHVYAGPTGSWITYTSLPYMPYMDAIGRGCGGGSVNGSTNGKLDGVTILASHEYAESVNNPGNNAYWDFDRSENGDKCSWTNTANKTLANGYSFPVQPSWSNLYRNSYLNGCLYSP